MEEFDLDEAAYDPGEISEGLDTQFAANFWTLQGGLQAEGILVQDTEYAGYGLSEIQRQLLETTVGEDPASNEVEQNQAFWSG